MESEEQYDENGYKYMDISPSYRPLLIGYAILGGLFILILAVFSLWDEIFVGLIILFIIVIGSFLFYQGLYPRYCPNCKKKMRFEFGNGDISETYYCDDCMLYTTSGVTGLSSNPW